MSLALAVDGAELVPVACMEKHVAQLTARIHGLDRFVGGVRECAPGVAGSVDDLASALVGPTGVVAVALDDEPDVDAVGDVLRLAVVQGPGRNRSSQPGGSSG